MIHLKFILESGVSLDADYLFNKLLTDFPTLFSAYTIFSSLIWNPTSNVHGICRYFCYCFYTQFHSCQKLDGLRGNYFIVNFYLCEDKYLLPQLFFFFRIFLIISVHSFFQPNCRLFFSPFRMKSILLRFWWGLLKSINSL